MSMPTFPTSSPKREDSINQILSSIAMEELGLSHILNAEGEKIQYVLGTLEGGGPPEPATIDDVLKVNDSVQNMLKATAYNQMFLNEKTLNVINAPTQPDGSLGEIVGSYPTLTDLQEAIPIGVPGKYYFIDPYVFAWDALNNQWINIGSFTGPQGPIGNTGPQGIPGATGPAGNNGLTPSIEANGNWWIGDTDTGVVAEKQWVDYLDQVELIPTTVTSTLLTTQSFFKSDGTTVKFNLVGTIKPNQGIDPASIQLSIPQSLIPSEVGLSYAASVQFVNVITSSAFQSARFDIRSISPTAALIFYCTTAQNASGLNWYASGEYFL